MTISVEDEVASSDEHWVTQKNLAPSAPGEFGVKKTGAFGAGRVWCVAEFGVRNRPLQNDPLAEFGVWPSLVCDDCTP